MNALVPLHPLVTALHAHSICGGSKPLKLLGFHGWGAGFDSRRLHHILPIFLGIFWRFLRHRQVTDKSGPQHRHQRAVRKARVAPRASQVCVAEEGLEGPLGDTPSLPPNTPDALGCGRLATPFHEPRRDWPCR
jgi:hypothetical protein